MVVVEQAGRSCQERDRGGHVAEGIGTPSRRGEMIGALLGQE